MFYSYVYFYILIFSYVYYISCSHIVIYCSCLYITFLLVIQHPYSTFAIHFFFLCSYPNFVIVILSFYFRSAGINSGLHVLILVCRYQSWSAGISPSLHVLVLVCTYQFWSA